jgi:hypothetical protein
VSDSVSYNHERVDGVDFARQQFGKFTAAGSTFTGCRFDRVQIADVSFGSGTEVTEMAGDSAEDAHYARSQLRDLLGRGFGQRQLLLKPADHERKGVLPHDCFLAFDALRRAIRS